MRLHGEQGEPAAGAAGRKNGWGWGLLDLYPAGRADNGKEQRRLERRLDDDGGRKQISPPAVSGGRRPGAEKKTIEIGSASGDNADQKKIKEGGSWKYQR